MPTTPRTSAPALPENLPELRAVVKAHLESLARQVDDRLRDEGFQEVLRNMARLWRYSLLNQHLIRHQAPKATWVTGLRSWEAMGRRLRVRQEPILVFAPFRQGGGELRFGVVQVYDVGQTRGRKFRELDVTLGGASSRWKVLEDAASKLGVEVRYGPLPAGIRGRSFPGRVELLPGLRGQERAAVLAHELAHEVLHQRERSRQAELKRPGPARTHAEVETEAEATSFVVLAALGLPSKAPDYIAWQRGTGLTVLRSLTRVQRAAREILGAASSSP